MRRMRVSSGEGLLPKIGKATPSGASPIDCYQLAFDVLLQPVSILVSMVNLARRFPTAWSHSDIFWVKKPGADVSDTSGSRSAWEKDLFKIIPPTYNGCIRKRPLLHYSHI